jgi:putative selenium metabolism hydrolase
MNMNVNEKIAEVAENAKEDLVTFLREIIAIPSMSGQEEAVVQRIKAEMLATGYDKVWCDPLGNLLGIMGSGERLIALDGHCDTVDVGSPDNWQYDPFEGKYQDGIIYGRGAADQKGGLASAVYAGKILKEVGLPAGVSLLVVASVLEEDHEGLCWQYILKEDRLLPEAVILTEPSSLGIHIGQRGRLEIKVATRGLSCHGSAPERGENAVYKMAPIIQDIERLNQRLHSTSVLGKGTVAITDVRSLSPSLCAVPDSAVIHLDRRLSEGETEETCIREIQSLPSVQAAGAGITVPSYEVKGYSGVVYPTRAYHPTWLMEASHPLVQSAQRAYRNQFSRQPEVGVWRFSTNGVTTKGLFDIPTIGLGPGHEEHAHSPADQVDAAGLIKAAQFYAALLLDWTTPPHPA